MDEDYGEIYDYEERTTPIEEDNADMITIYGKRIASLKEEECCVIFAMSTLAHSLNLKKLAI